jgi:hypothetical protein
MRVERATADSSRECKLGMRGRKTDRGRSRSIRRLEHVGMRVGEGVVRGLGRARCRRCRGWSDERGVGGRLVMGRAEEGWVGDCRRVARRSLAVGGAVEERARMMRKLDGCSAIGIECQIRRMKRALWWCLMPLCCSWLGRRWNGSRLRFLTLRKFGATRPSR